MSDPTDKLPSPYKPGLAVNEATPLGRVLSAAHDRRGQLSGASLMRHQQCQQMLLCLTGPTSVVTGHDDAGGGILQFDIDDPLIVDRFKEELDSGMPSENTSMARAITDLCGVMTHYYGLGEGSLTLAAHTRRYSDEITDQEVVQWLGTQIGIEGIRDAQGHEQLRVSLQWPHMMYLEDWHANWKADSQALIEAIDQGVLEISDAARYMDNGHGSYGYGRA